MTDQFSSQEPGAAAQAAPEPTAEEIAAQRKAEAHAEHENHPHTQLKKIAADMRVPNVDLHARINLIHGALARLIQVVLTHTPPPHDLENGDGERR